MKTIILHTRSVQPSVKGSHILNDTGALDKAIAEHKLYKMPLMLVRDRDSGRFMTVKFNEKNDKNNWIKCSMWRTWPVLSVDFNRLREIPKVITGKS